MNKNRKPKRPRPAATYRAARRNAHFGRKPHGNTKPHERRAIWKALGR